MKNHKSKTYHFILIFLAITNLYGQKNTSYEKIDDESIFLEGLKFYQLEDYKKAIDHFTILTKKDKQNAAINFKLAQSYLALGKETEAEEFAEKAFKGDLANNHYKSFLLSFYKKKGKLNKAIELLEKNKRDFMRIEEHRKLAELYLKNKNFNKALNTYGEIEEKYGVSEDISKGKIKIYQQLNQKEKAIEEWVKLIENQLGNVNVSIEYIHYLLEEKDSIKAEKEFQKLEKKDPENEKIAILKTKIYPIDDSDTSKKIALKELIESDDIKFLEKESIIRGLLEKKDSITALELASVLAKKYHEQESAQLVYADLLKATKHYIEAGKAYFQALKINGNNYKAWEELIEIDLKTINFNLMQEHASSAIDLFPNSAKLHYYLGVAYSNNEKDFLAKKSFEHALKLSSNESLNKEIKKQLEKIDK